MMTIVLPVSLVGALWFAWANRWWYFWIAYVAAWAIVMTAILYARGGGTGTHGTASDQLAWGILIIGPWLVVACFVVGVLAFTVGYLGRRL